MFIMSVHVPIIGLSGIPVIAGDWPLLLLPLHIVLLGFVIDPSCTLVFEAEREDPIGMLRPPRSPNERLFSAQTVLVAIAQGAHSLPHVFSFSGQTTRSSAMRPSGASRSSVS